MNSGVIRVVLFAAVLLCPCSVFAQTYRTGYTGADCTDCGFWLPWAAECQWGDAEIVRRGFYREFAGDKGSASCHGGGEAVLPHSESIAFAMGERKTYILKSGSWTWFGLDFTYSYMTTESTTVTRNNSCAAPGCCLVPLKGFVRWNYEQCVRKLEIATVWYFCPGTAARCYDEYDPCVACNDSTRQIGVLCKYPSPELLSPEFARHKVMPYEKRLLTLPEICER